MPNWANEIEDDFISNVSNPASKGVNWADEVEKEALKPIQRHYAETGAISTITGKPEKTFTGLGGSGASTLTHLKQGFVGDPITKIKIYAKDRFPDMTEDERLARYRMQKGEVVYKDNDGKWYSEAPELFHNKLKRFVGETAAHSPAIIGGTVGAASGNPLLTGLLTAGGEGIRKSIGALAFDEPQTAMGNVRDMAGEAAIGVGGDVAGRGLVRAGRRMLSVSSGPRGMRLAKMAGKDLPTIDFAKAAKLQEKYREKFGVELFDGQTTGSRRLLDKTNLYGDLPDTADIIAAAKEIQDEQAHNAIERFLGDIAPPKDPLRVGEDLSATADKSIKREVGKMVAKAKPLYDEAFKSKQKINIAPHIKALNEEIKTWPLNSAERNKLIKYRSMLFKEAKRDVPVDEGGFLYKGTKKEAYLVPEDRIQVLDKLKKSTDKFLEPKVGDKPIDNKIKSVITDTKNNILSDIDKVNKKYAEARRVWGGDAAALEKLTNKRVLSQIAELEGDQAVRATRTLFSNMGSSPEIVHRVRSRIIKENPKVWNSALRYRIADIFESTKGSAKGGAADSAKQFGAFWRNTVGDPKQKKILQAAMGGPNSAQWKNFSDITDMLRRVSWVVRGESTTAIRQESLRQEKEGLVSGAIKSWAYPLITYKKVMWDKLKELNTTRGRMALAEALVNPRAKKYIPKMGLKTEAGIRAASTFASLVLGGEFSRHDLDLYHSYRKDKRH